MYAGYEKINEVQCLKVGRSGWNGIGLTPSLSNPWGITLFLTIILVGTPLFFLVLTMQCGRSDSNHYGLLNKNCEAGIFPSTYCPAYSKKGGK